MRLRHVVVNGWFVDEGGTGSGQYLRHLLEALPAASTETRWTLLVPEGRLPSQLPASVTTAVLRLPRLAAPLQKVWWEQVIMPRAASRLRADLLWTPYWAAPLLCSIPQVVTIHDLIPLLLPHYSRGVKQGAYNALVSASARRSTATITVSEASARDVVIHLQIPAERVHAIHHGPNFTHAATGEEVARVRERYRLPRRYFLYLGGFDKRKNLETLMAAYARYLQRGGDAGVRLVIAGRLPEGDTEFAPAPRRIARETGIAAHVDFVGWVDEEDKPALYAGATAFFFPSLYEGFGMPVLEAMQAGAPVVTSGESER
jgi:glycosyltransferase involved in cell wall biosynthesis